MPSSIFSRGPLPQNLSSNGMNSLYFHAPTARRGFELSLLLFRVVQRISDISQGLGLPPTQMRGFGPKFALVPTRSCVPWPRPPQWFSQGMRAIAFVQLLFQQQQL
mmetsp:Transcript_70501/g.153136  ORF Transcript_70501/g.153136 Transcript_70501/m.153136 type:complete len:106 (-) Transcript_70501:283-600(-)